jgi:hypothetical protein
MMFILRTSANVPSAAEIQVKVTRKTPKIVPSGAGKTDYFCIGEAEAIAALRAAGWEVVELRDGWYADDDGGGIAISGHGKYWEIRDTPFTVREAVGPAPGTDQAEPAAGDLVNVRHAIFGV